MKGNFDIISLGKKRYQFKLRLKSNRYTEKQLVNLWTSRRSSDIYIVWVMFVRLRICKVGSCDSFITSKITYNKIIICEVIPGDV